MEFFRTLFSSGGFMPHGFCYLWSPGLVWLHAGSDSLIALAYSTIPVTLVYFIRKRRDMPWELLIESQPHLGTTIYARVALNHRKSAGAAG